MFENILSRKWLSYLEQKQKVIFVKVLWWPGNKLEEVRRWTFEVMLVLKITQDILIITLFELYIKGSTNRCQKILHHSKLYLLHKL